jgi:Adenine specific DNA methylase Mod
MAAAFKSNTLFYGDNLEVLRKHFPDESVGLIYLDPPFNSKADYNILFKEQTGERSTAQIQAFSDFWHWDIEAKHAYEYLVSQAPLQLGDLVTSLYNFLGKNDVLAYLVMMGVRRLELHRVLEPHGAIFLHCDPTSNHYLRILLDSIFGTANFRNEIVWRRSHPKGNAFTRFASNHDTILVYAKNAKFVKWKMSYKDYDEEK